MGVPSLAFDIMLSMQEDKIELMTDPDMISMVQSGIRGGISVINQRHETASEDTTFTYSGIKQFTILKNTIFQACIFLYRRQQSIR